MTLDVRGLVVLRAIAEHRSFTRAAEALFMTQPAVSRRLASLERAVGVELVARGPRHVALTPAGAALVEEAEAIIPSIDRAERRLRGFARADGGAVRLGAVPSAMTGFVTGALSALLDRRPTAELRIDEGWSTDLVRLARRGEIDVAVVSRDAVPGAPDRDALLREPFVALVAAGHPFAQAPRPTLAELADERWVMAPQPGGRGAVLAACAAAGFRPDVAASAGWDSAADLVALGVGVALAPATVARQLAHRDGLVSRSLGDAPSRELVLVRGPGERPSAIEGDLEECLREAARHCARLVTEPTRTDRPARSA